MSSAVHTIRVVSNRTGLSAHVIRIWEKRYAAVVPQRTETNRRLYTENDIERLCTLSWLTRNGHTISAVAQLPLEELRGMAQRSQSTASKMERRSAVSTVEEQHLERCLEEIRGLNASGLERALQGAILDLGNQGFLQKLICPLAWQIGELWQRGEITAAHEHFASSAIKIFVGHTAKSFMPAEGTPSLIVATPSGQVHELGAIIVSAIASSQGWRTTYLGASLPATEIAGAARQNDSVAVALSIVYPTDDRDLAQELFRLRDYLAEDVEILVGGRAANAYADTLEAIGAHVITALPELETLLQTLREPRN